MSVKEEPRTSASQLRWVGRVISHFLGATFKHIGRFGLAYGFLFGVISTFVTLAAIIWYGVLAYPLPWKVTDPRDPRFDFQQFKFADYTSDSEFGAALRVMLPLGTDKAHVDQILVEYGGAGTKFFIGKNQITDDPLDQLYYYSFRNFRSVISEAIAFVPEGEFTWKVLIVYDEHNKLKALVVI